MADFKGPGIDLTERRRSGEDVNIRVVCKSECDERLSIPN